VPPFSWSPFSTAAAASSGSSSGPEWRCTQEPPRIALDRLEEALLLVDRSVREPLPEELGIDPDRRFLEPSA
jgi:hypothetical protein